MCTHCHREQPVTWGDGNVSEVDLASVQAAVDVSYGVSANGTALK